jgi:hypothetical protein
LLWAVVDLNVVASLNKISTHTNTVKATFIE